jgi:hypothetical protein
MGVINITNIKTIKGTAAFEQLNAYLRELQ